MIVLQCIFHSNVGFFKTRKHYSIMITFIHTESEREIVKNLFEITRYNRLVMERKDGCMYYHAVLYTNVEYTSAHLSKIMSEHPFILSIERVDES